MTRKLFTYLFIVTSALVYLQPAIAQVEGWIHSTENRTEGWMFAGSEDGYVFELPNDENWTAEFPAGCIPYYEPDCCAAWSDSNWVEFSRLEPTEDIDIDNSLMFGGFNIYLENYEGQELILGGVLEDFSEPITITATYDTDVLNEHYIREYMLKIMYYDDWSEMWREIESEYTFDYENKTVEISGYVLHSTYGFFGSEFLNRPPKFVEIPEEVIGEEGRTNWFVIKWNDPDDIDDVYLDVFADEFPGETAFYDLDIGEGELVMRSAIGDAGEYTVSFVLTDDEGVTAQADVNVVLEPSLSVGSGDQTLLPNETALVSNFPNPFNSSTTIAYALREAANVRLEVFDLNGARVATLIDGYTQAGRHNLTWDLGNSVSSRISAGNYILNFKAGNINQQRAIQFIK